MFTLYIHCLEVLAMKAEGQTVKTIVSMGCEWSSNKVHAALQSLMDEGYVTCDDSGKVNVWTITEKACEYCERIARLYAQSHVMDEIADYVGSVSQKAIAPTHDAITEVLETHKDVTYMGDKVSFPLTGELTIAEAVENIEAVSAVTVTRASLDNGIVTLTLEPLPDVNTDLEPEECYECGGSCNYHEEWCPYNYA